MSFLPLPLLLPLLFSSSYSSLASLVLLFFSPTPLCLPPLNRKYIRAEFTCNEWAGIILVCACVPIVLLYLIWIIATVTGTIKAPAHYPDADACLKPLSRARPGALQHANSSLPPTHTQSVPLENEWLEANKPSRFAPV